MKNICYIIGASVTEGMYIDRREGDFVIAADAGFSALEKIGVTADLAVGDFDSLGHVPRLEKTVCHPADKDDTDTALALAEGMKLGFRNFVIYGGFGGRLDHTIANLQNCAGAADHGAVCWLWGEGNAACTFSDGALRFEAGKTGLVSVFAADRACGVTLQGLKFPLDNACLTSTVPLGVSNEFTGRESIIRVEDGTLIVMWNEDAKSFLNRIREICNEDISV
ncbi:MAG: thiamine diphosphokinase [Clostridiales bacterium]|jgi:thiamine pyrophosphokinase|nr:thiamine diphosphokinase [Clostridiales bacterium]